MKKRLTQILALSVLVVLCLSTSTLATARRASLYLNDYYVNSAALSGGRVVIEFDVDATKTVSQVGAGCIVLQEKNSSGKWTNVAYYYPVDYPDMVAYNRSSHEGSVTYYGTVGNQYRGIVTVYANKKTASVMKSRGPKEAPWEMADSWMLHPPQRLIRLGSHELVQAGVAGKAVE